MINMHSDKPQWMRSPQRGQGMQQDMGIKPATIGDRQASIGCQVQALEQHLAERGGGEIDIRLPQISRIA